jgi:polysaccharide export outer membrane protein
VVDVASLDKVARLKPGLGVQVDVLVLGKKEIEERSKRVSDEGTITLPLVGTIRVEGMTLAEVSADLTRRYGAFFVRPQVVVDFVTEKGPDVASPWGYVTVLGSVRNPGRVNIPATQDLTLSAAIQQAGGLKPSGKESAIKVSRRNDNGKTDAFDVNLRALGTRGEKGEDPVLQAGDVVFVPEMVF